jgi:hypothetical protein
VNGLGLPVQELLDPVQAFRRPPPTPQRTHALEQLVAAVLREAGRVLRERVDNGLEPEHREGCPLRLRGAGQEYRRRPKSRNPIGTRFGEIDRRR